MKKYQKQIDGKTVIKALKEIVIKKDGRVIYNPTEEMVLSDGWVEYIQVKPSIEIPERVKYQRALARKLRDLKEYDNSSNVNSCIIVYQGHELSYWASKDERNDLKNAVRDCISIGRTEYRLDLRDKGISILLNCELLLKMMAALEVYAIDCFNKTTDHEYAIKALSIVEDVEAYDFTVGYPNKLRFEV